MYFDLSKLSKLRSPDSIPIATGKLQCCGRMLLVPCDLPAAPVLEAILDREEQQLVEMFQLDFPDTGAFLRGEELVNQIKKNFSGNLFGSFTVPPEPALIDRAYAAGLDLIQIPLTGDNSHQWSALNYARTVFPAWSVIAQVPVLSLKPTLLKTLLRRKIVPWPNLKDVPQDVPNRRFEETLDTLFRSWQRYEVSLGPLHPLLELTTPWVPPPRPQGLVGLISRIGEVRQRTGLDLRRLLRVRGVADSFDSAGL